MNDYEVSFSERRIVECWFQQQGVTAALLIKSANTADNVDMHSKTKPSGLTSDVAKEKILKCFVVRGRRLAASYIARIDAPRHAAVSFIKVELTQVSRFKLHSQRAIAFLGFQRGVDNLREVNIQRRGQ